MATNPYIAGRTLHRALSAIHKFHVRYRWAFALIVTGSAIIVLFGAAELGKCLFGLGMEQVLLHLGEWATSAGETAERAS